MKRAYRRGLILLVAAAAAIAIVPVAKGVGRAQVARERGVRQDLLKQLGHAFRMYAAADPGERWPPRDADAWRPDLELFGPWLDVVSDKEAVLDYLQGGRGVQLCYVSHAVADDLYGLRLLEHYAEEVPRNVMGSRLPAEGTAEVAEGIRKWSYPTSFFRASRYFAEPEIYRLHEGVGRYWVHEIHGSSAFAHLLQSGIPVCWEMPEGNLPVGGNVLFMDGHVEFVRFPSRFPMTEPFVANLRALMPPLSEQDTAFGTFQRWASGVSAAGAVTGGAYYFTTEIQGDKFSVNDWTPNVEVAGHKGYRVFAGVPLMLFPDSIEIPEGFKERLWQDLREHAKWSTRPESVTDPFIADMGTGHGFRWFAYTTAARQDGIREHLGLAGGDDRLQVLIDHRAYLVMPRLGERAVPHLVSVVNGEGDRRTVFEALLALERMPGDSAQEALTQAFDEDNPMALRNAETVAFEFDSEDYRASHLAEAALLRASDADRAAEIALRAELRRHPRGGYPGVDGLAVLKELPRESAIRAFGRVRADGMHPEERLAEIRSSLHGEETGDSRLLMHMRQQGAATVRE